MVVFVCGLTGADLFLSVLYVVQMCCAHVHPCTSCVGLFCLRVTSCRRCAPLLVHGAVSSPPALSHHLSPSFHLQGLYRHHAILLAPCASWESLLGALPRASSTPSRGHPMTASGHDASICADDAAHSSSQLLYFPLLPDFPLLHEELVDVVIDADRSGGCKLAVGKCGGHPGLVGYAGCRRGNSGRPTGSRR